MNKACDHLASASRFAIAAAIVYFAWQLAQVVDKVSVVTQSVDQVSQQIPPTLQEVREIRLEIAEIRKQIPEILAEAEAVRGELPAVIGEVAAIRHQVPPLLERIDALERQIGPILKQVDEAVNVIDQTQRQIPDIVASADNAVVALNDTRQEFLPLVPRVLDEVKLSREKVDPTLDRVEALVEDTYTKARNAIEAAETAGQQASEGAVKGFFTGIFKLPFELVGTLASPILKNIDKDVARQLTEKDVELMARAGKKVAESGELEKEQRWENPNSGNSGTITIMRKYRAHDTDCVEARITVSNRRKEILDKLGDFCLNDESRWVDAAELGG